MRRNRKISTINRKPLLTLGLLAALIVVCTSVFQFSLEPIAANKAVHSSVAESGPDKSAATESSRADDNKDAARTICTIQAVSQGVQLHVSYEPLVWESLDIDAPDFRVEIPRQFYKASWEYFRVLFTDIIAPNAP